VQALELTRLACEPGRVASDGSRYTAKDILATVARQLGNTPAVCKKAYVHPAVLSLGSALASTEADAASALLERIAGRRSARPSRGLHAAERRLLAFLQAHRRELQAATRQRKSAKPASGPATSPGTSKHAPLAVRKAAPARPRVQPAPSEKRTLSRSSAMR